MPSQQASTSRHLPAANAPLRPWLGSISRLAIPIILANSSTPLVGIADTAVMGRMGDPKWIAATGVGALIFSTVFWGFGFLRMGTGGLVAQAYRTATGSSTSGLQT